MWFPCILIFVVLCLLLISTGNLSFLLPLYVITSIPTTSGDDKTSSFNSLRKICECGAGLKESGRSAKITLYTRYGVVLNAVHHEKRCRSCGRGYFYSFHTHGKYLYYDDTCLEQAYLITSRKTGFAIDLLYEWSLSILHHSSSFTSMAEQYIDFHLGNVEDLDVSRETREALCEKRLSEGWFLYSLLEIKQRYLIEGL